MCDVYIHNQQNKVTLLGAHFIMGCEIIMKTWFFYGFLEDLYPKP